MREARASRRAGSRSEIQPRRRHPYIVLSVTLAAAAAWRTPPSRPHASATQFFAALPHADSPRGQEHTCELADAAFLPSGPLLEASHQIVREVQVQARGLRRPLPPLATASSLFASTGSQDGPRAHRGSASPCPIKIAVGGDGRVANVHIGTRLAGEREKEGAEHGAVARLGRHRRECTARRSARQPPWDVSSPPLRPQTLRHPRSGMPIVHAQSPLETSAARFHLGAEVIRNAHRCGQAAWGGSQSALLEPIEPFPEEDADELRDGSILTPSCLAQPGHKVSREPERHDHVHRSSPWPAPSSPLPSSATHPRRPHPKSYCPDAHAVEPLVFGAAREYVLVMLKHASLSPHDLIDGSTPREVFRRHDVACAPCRELFILARGHGGHELLNAWRTQLASHLANEAERRDFDRL